MDGKETLPAFGRQHEEFDLAAFNKVEHLVRITTTIDVCVSRNLDGAKILRLALQRSTGLLFELVGLMSLLNRHHVSFQCPRWLHQRSTSPGLTPLVFVRARRLGG